MQMKVLTILLLLLALHVSAIDDSPVHHHEDDELRFPSRTFTKCGFTSSENHATWYGSLFTNSPVMFPTNDLELANIVTTAKANGCKVRVRGSGHSEDGLVMQKLDELDEQVIVVNLKDYIPDDPSWHRNLNQAVPSVKMSAGSSLLAMMQFIRPQGYLTRTHTAGRIFNLGGVYLNPSTHGAAYGESRLAAQVLSVRVMNADGDITEYSGADVISFRGSMGLLGIVTALEIRLRQDAGMQMYQDSLRLRRYDRNELVSFYQQKVTNDDLTEFFYFVYDDTVLALSEKFDGRPGYDFASTQAWYDDRVSQFPDLAYKGSERNILNNLVVLLSRKLNMTLILAKLFSTVTLLTIKQTWKQYAEEPNGKTRM